MSIKSFIEKVCVQPAVYWEFTGPDGYGGIEYNNAVEISVRWDEKIAVVTDNMGKEITSSAQVLTPNDLKEQSILKLGELSALPANPDPDDIDDTYEIKFMDRYPLFKSKTLDVFIAYLGR